MRTVFCPMPRNIFIRHQSIYKYIFILLLFFLPIPAFALQLESDHYTIQRGTIEVNTNQGQSPSSRATPPQALSLLDGIGPEDAASFGHDGYVVHHGDKDEMAAVWFSLAVSPAMLYYDDLSPDIPLEKTLLLRLQNDKTTGYSIHVYQNTPLRTNTGLFIPDTNCDIYANAPCTTVSAGTWSDSSTFGFGYTVMKSTSPDDFRSGRWFRPFPSLDRQEGPVKIIQSYGAFVTEDIELKVRLLISNKQPTGQYRNTISIVALPSL